MAETFVSMGAVRCPTCRQLGWVRSEKDGYITGVLAEPRIFMKIEGTMLRPSSDVFFVYKCGTCRSSIRWKYASYEFEVLKLGIVCTVRHRQAHQVFE